MKNIIIILLAILLFIGLVLMAKQDVDRSVIEDQMFEKIAEEQIF
jgi:hypothetical protein